jgi:sensor histidine kinase regulating citrate/malate metabolism
MAVLTCSAIMVIACFLAILFNLSGFDENINNILTWLAVGLLFIIIGIILMYEMFAREEIRNIDLAIRLQHLELEAQFFKELDVMQAELRTWRHEYKNNLIALRALIKSSSKAKTLEYLDKISIESFKEDALLQTGNLILDAVVSAKLMYAHSKGIEISIQAVYPENNVIEDNDLCAIAGNLLDNAIEACERMKHSEQKRYIIFSILVQGKNLSLSIQNSYGGEIKRAGKKFLTHKNDQFHGFGLAYVDSIVDKYQGNVLHEYKDGIFKTHVMLPLIPAQI